MTAAVRAARGHAELDDGAEGAGYGGHLCIFGIYIFILDLALGPEFRGYF